MQKTFKTLAALLFVSLLAACGGKKEVSADDWKQAAQAAGDAAWANYQAGAAGDAEKALAHYAAAEKALTRATTLNPGNADYWFDLAIARARIKDKSGAKTAFKSVISVCKDAFAKDPQNPTWLIKQIRPLIMLGRADDARALLDKAVKQFPTDAQVLQFKNQDIIGTLLKDPQLKDFSV
jgi:tetratricopeptide (TPR) repeat protein